MSETTETREGTMKKRVGWRAVVVGLAVACLVVTACGAVADAGGGRILGDEELSFEERRIDVGGPTSDALAFDANADGHLDAVLAGAGIVVLPGDGAGGFDVSGPVPAGENPTGVAAGDLDGDGWTDLVVANHETHYVTLLFGGSEGFGARDPSRIDVDVGPHPHAVRVADVDADGHLDFVVDDRHARALRLFLGPGDGTFREGDPIDVGGDPYRGMALGDVNADGHVDVVTPNPRAVAVQLGDGAGGFTRSTRSPELRAPGVSPFGVAIADVNGDGLADLGVGGGEGQGTFAVWLGTGGGAFELAGGSPVEIAEGPVKVRVADVDGDGRQDFLATSYVGDGVTVVRWLREAGRDSSSDQGSDGDRSALRVTRLTVEQDPWGVAAGDFDGDGRTDLVVALDDGEEVVVLLGRDG